MENIYSPKQESIEKLYSLKEKLNYSNKSKDIFYDKQNSTLKNYNSFNIDKNFFKKDNSFVNNINININSNPIIYNPTILGIQSVVPHTVTFEPFLAITADNIAEYAFPLAQFIHETNPDYVIACDRGARMIGVAVHMMYRELYGDFPTQDKRLHFRKLSRKIPFEGMKKTMQKAIETMLQEVESPTVLILDDWVSSGGTKDAIQRVFDDLSGGKITLIYGVMRGKGGDVSGNEKNHGFPDWTDNPYLVGVDYDTLGMFGHSVDSTEARLYRARMSRNIKQFVKGIQQPELGKDQHRTTVFSVTRGPLYTSY